MQQGENHDNLNQDGSQSPGTDSSSVVDVQPLVSMVDRLKNKPTINVLALVCMGFFWVSGGMYGNEELMKVGAPIYALPCLLVVPVLYSCPVSLINSEMANAMPWEGGAVAWIGEALGQTLGGHTAYWIWFSSVLDSALYPRFAAAYLSKQLDLDRTQTGFTAMGITLIINLVKLAGLKSVVSVSIFLCVIAVTPSFILVGIGFSKINWDIISTNDKPTTNFSELMTWVLWLYQGVLSMGSVSKDVKNAGRTYLVSSVILFSLDVLIVNFTPLLISLSIDSDRSHYEAGHFIQIGNTLAHGRWLGILLTVASQISLIGLYQSGSVASDQYLSRFLHNYILASSTAPRVQKMHSASPLLHESPKRSKIREWFLGAGADTGEAESGVPRIMVLINGAIVMALCWASIASTLTVSVLLMTLGIGLLTISFLVIKFRPQDPSKKAMIPGGRVGAVFVAFPCLSLVGLNIGLSMSDTTHTIHGVPVRSFSFGVVLLVGVFAHLSGRWIRKRWKHRSARQLMRVVIMPPDPIDYGTETN